LSDGAVATADRQVVFAPQSREQPISGEWGVHLGFRGTVTFKAHLGALFVRLSDPWVSISDGHGELSVVNPRKKEAGSRLRLATFEIDSHLIADGFEHWAASNVRLAPDSCELFNEVYPAGTLLEPLIIIVPETIGP